MAFLTTNPSPFLINVPEFQNVITSAVGDAGYSNTIINLQTLINTDTATANLNTIRSSNGAAISINNNLNLLNTSIEFLGSNLLTSNAVNGPAGYLAFEAAGVEGARLTPTGLGIGTTAPVSTLDVRGLLTLTGGISVNSSVIATTPAQKIAFWGGVPTVQPTNAISPATFIANTSGITDDSASYGGYTMGQIVAALKQAGLLA